MELRHQIEEDNRIILQLKSHNQALQHLRHSDSRRRPRESPVNNNDDSRNKDEGTLITSRKLSLIGSVDEELRNALEELKAFKPLQVPVRLVRFVCSFFLVSTRS